MTTDRPPRPRWTDKYLLWNGWTQDEFLDLLCGLPPHPHADTPLPADAPLPTTKETADVFAREELRRVEAGRHVDDAILTRRLTVIASSDDALLKKLQEKLQPEEFETIRRDVVHHRSCSKVYRFEPVTAIRWAALLRALFPDFPFSVEDLRPASDVAPSGAISPELKARRRESVRQAVRAAGFKTQTDFCRRNEISQDTLRAVVTGDSHRADLALWTPRVLTLLQISADTWNTA